MENLAMNIVDEVVEEAYFKVDNDSKAEWALKKIIEEKAELRRYELVCNDVISQYQGKLDQAKDNFESKTLYFKQQLQNYFETITPKVTKTQAFVKVKESVDWAGLKKVLIQKDNKLITEDGEIVEGVNLQQKPDKFEVDV